MLLNQLSRALYEIRSTQKTNLDVFIYIYLFCLFQGENAEVANAKRFAKRRVCSLVSVQVMKTPVKFAVNKEILVHPTEPTTLVVRSISLTVGLVKEKKHRASVIG